MIGIPEARSRVLACVGSPTPVSLPVREAVGLLLAEPATSDIDSPPFDKALVDGYAVRAEDVAGGPVKLTVVEQATAGQVPTRPVLPGTATQIMTGTLLPPGADAVVPVESTRPVDGETPTRVYVAADRLESGQGILRRGAALQRGATVLAASHVVRAVDVGLLCEVGCCRVTVWRRPRVAVLATGSELVPASQTPGAGQIRNSNGPMLSALAQAARCDVSDLGIARDDVAALQSAIEHGLDGDVLLLSGGVSVGVLDLVPQALAQAGVQRVFHQVHLKPGKPLWFGVGEGGSHRTLVFALPGNPMGSLVCFQLFVLPALRAMVGHAVSEPAPQYARLAEPYRHRSDRPTYVPAMIARAAGGEFLATPLAWQGSADQRAVGAAHGLALFPPGDCTCAAGQVVEILFFDEVSCGEAGPVPEAVP